MSRRRTPLRNASEYVLSRTVLAVARALPDRAIEPLSTVLGSILDLVLAGRRRVVSENATLAFGPEGRSMARALSRSSFASLCRSFIELDRLPGDQERMKEIVRIRNQPSYDRLMSLLKDGPVVFAASHFGSYEIGGVAARCIGLDITTLVRPLDNPWLDLYLSGIRMRFGQTLVTNRGGARSMLDSLEKGRSVCVLVDLNKRGRAVFVRYFGQPAATAATAAQLAIRSHRPIVPVFNYRSKTPMNFEVEFGEPIWPRAGSGRSEEIQRLLQEATTQVEARVRAAPDQWLWTHRRWKSRPEAEQVKEAAE